MAAAALASADSASNQSHSSSRLNNNSNSNSNPSFQVHKPLSLADALSRAGGDVTQALDAVLADRNRLALEVNKVNGENHRIWNLMGRIRKENDLLKARNNSITTSTGDSNSIGHGSRGSPSSSSFNTLASQSIQNINNSASSPSNNNPQSINPQVPVRRRPMGSTASQSDRDQSPSLLGTSPSISSDSSSLAAVTPNINSSTSAILSSPSSNNHDVSNETMLASGATSSSNPNTTTNQPPIGMGISHSSTPPSTIGYSNQMSRSPLAIDSFAARSSTSHQPSSSDPPLSPSSVTSGASAQQSSIIQQRAAARARAQESMSQSGHGGADGSRSGHHNDFESRIAGGGGGGRDEVRDSMQSQDFVAVDGSEVDEEETIDQRDRDLDGTGTGTGSESNHQPDAGTRGVGAAALGVLSGGEAASLAGTSTSDLSGSTPTASTFADVGASGPEVNGMENLSRSGNGYNSNNNSTAGPSDSVPSSSYQTNPRTDQRYQYQDQQQQQHQQQVPQGSRHTPNSSASGSAFSPRVKPLQLSHPPNSSMNQEMTPNRNRSGSGTGNGSNSLPGTPRRERDYSSSNPVYQTPTTPNGTSSNTRSRSSSSSQAPRLDAQLLSSTRVRVVRSVIKSNERGREVVSFHIVVEVFSSPAALSSAVAASENEESGNSTASPPNSTQPLRKWTVDKLYSDVLALDARLKQKHGRSATKRINTAQLPDKTLFKDNAPSKVDMRKIILEGYLLNLLVVQLPDKDDLCTFLCTDVLPPKISDPHSLTKEGFLTKKGQNLGRWVTRWYVLRGARLDYYDTRGGSILGSVNIAGAQLGRQQKSSVVDTDENSYRHAFLLLEKRVVGGPSAPSVSSVTSAAAQSSSTTTGSGLGGDAQTVRHVLCAQSDPERDEWVDVLVRAVAEIDRTERKSLGSHHANDSNARSEQPQGRSKRSNSASNRLRKDSKDASSQKVGSGSREESSEPTSVPHHKSSSSSVGNEQQQQYSSNDAGGSGIPPPGPSSPPPSARFGGVKSSQDQGRPSLSVTDRPSTPDGSGPTSSTGSGNRASVRPAISGPMNGTPIPTGYKFGAKDSDSSTDASNAASSGSGSGGGAGKKEAADKKGFWAFRGFRGNDKTSAPRHEPRPVFGVPLAESIAISSIAEGLELPSVVFRCIEYLEKKEAAKEEGIYRLSGSTAVIKGLKERFNNEGDVDLLAADHEYDPHAIAGLLKTFLRELPTSVLTRELHLDFMRVNDIIDRRERVNELGQLVCMLPLANYSLLRMLCSHLIKIIKHSDENKMTMRNVGIVFSPTLAIPAGVFALFLTEFDWVFYTDAGGEPAPRQIEEDILPPDEDELGTTRSQGHEDAPAPISSLSPPVSARSGGRNANRSSWMVGNSLHDGGAGIGSAPINLNQERNKRNSLQYNESAADKLLGLQGASLITEAPEEYENGREAGYDDDVDVRGHHRRDLERSEPEYGLDERADFDEVDSTDAHGSGSGGVGQVHSLSGHEYQSQRGLEAPNMAQSFSHDANLAPQRFASTPPISPGGRNLRAAPQLNQFDQQQQQYQHQQQHQQQHQAYSQYPKSPSNRSQNLPSSPPPVA